MVEARTIAPKSTDQDSMAGVAIALDRDEHGHYIQLHIHNAITDAVTVIQGTVRYPNKDIAEKHVWALVQCMDHCLGGVFSDVDSGQSN